MLMNFSPLPLTKNKNAGISRDKTMADNLIYIPNNDTQNYTSVVYNLWLKHLDTKLNKGNESPQCC